MESSNSDDYELVEMDERKHIWLKDLLRRWYGLEVDGIPLDFALVDNMVRTGQLTAYELYDYVLKGGRKVDRGLPTLSIEYPDPEVYALPCWFIREEIILFEVDNLCREEVSSEEAIREADTGMPEEESGDMITVSRREWHLVNSRLKDARCRLDMLENSTVPGLKERIRELEGEVGERDQRIQNLEAEAGHKLWGVPGKVMAMRLAGKSDVEIAQILQEFHLPRKAVGALLRMEDNFIDDYGQWFDQHIKPKIKPKKPSSTGEGADGE